jgi:hypothetical protein
MQNGVAMVYPHQFFSISRVNKLQSQFLQRSHPDHKTFRVYAENRSLRAFRVPLQRLAKVW